MTKGSINCAGLLVLSSYNDYANRNVLDVVSNLTEAEFVRDFKMSVGNVQKMLQHIKEGEAYFLSTCQEKPYTKTKLPGLKNIRSYWGDLGDDFHGFIERQTDEDLVRVIKVQFGERVFQFPVWQLLTQAFNHSMIHRGELSILLTELGHPLPDMDIIIQFIKESGQKWPLD